MEVFLLYDGGMTRDEYFKLLHEHREEERSGIYRYYKMGSKAVYSQPFDCIKVPNLKDKQENCTHDYIKINENKPIYESEEEARKSIKSLMKDDLLKDFTLSAHAENKEFMMDLEAQYSSSTRNDIWCWKCGHYTEK